MCLRTRSAIEYLPCKGGGTECRRVLRKVRKPWFLLTCFFSFHIKRVFANAPPLKVGWAFSPTMNIHVRPLTLPSPVGRGNTLRNHTAIASCHSELAVKSVETNSKRDFMPLPGVSESRNRELPLTLTLSRLGFAPRSQSVASELPLCGLHLLAIRIRFAPSVRKSAVGRGNIMRHCGLRPAIALPQHHVAAKSVETKSKRDFMPLPGVSESRNRELPLTLPSPAMGEGKPKQP